jgi:hypothetical protein
MTDGDDYANKWTTKRERFAESAMIGLLSNPVYHNPNEKHKMVSVSDLSETAVCYADALIKSLNKYNK